MLLLVHLVMFNPFVVTDILSPRLLRRGRHIRIRRQIARLALNLHAYIDEKSAYSSIPSCLVEFRMQAPGSWKARDRRIAIVRQAAHLDDTQKDHYLVKAIHDRHPKMSDDRATRQRTAATSPQPFPFPR